jgi:hypothetical protein
VDNLTEKDLEWIAKQERTVKDGEKLLGKASNDALDYMKDIVDNLNDRQWRKMAMDKHALEIGVGTALVEHLVPTIYKDMEKSMHKKLKVSKPIAKALREIYIGRVIKNIKEELDGRSK